MMFATGSGDFGGKRRSIETLISSGTTIQGDVLFVGCLRLEGRVLGKLIAQEGASAMLIVSESGEVLGDIRAPSVLIQGSVFGDVFSSEFLSLGESAEVNGNLHYTKLSMEVGCLVNGNLQHRLELPDCVVSE